MSEHDSRTYLAWANSFARLLGRLGPDAPKGLDDVLAELRGGKADKPAVAAPVTAHGAD